MSDTQEPTNISIFNLPDDSRGSLIVKLNIALNIISTALISLRLFSRGFMSRSLGVDDLLAFIAYVIFMVISCMEIVTVGFGTGTPMHEVPKEKIPGFFSHLRTLELLYFSGIGIVRLSILAFYPRLSNDKRYLICVYSVAFVIITSTLIVFFFVIFSCKHIPDLWDITAPNRQCVDILTEARMINGHAIVGILTDLSLVALPIWVVYTTMKFSPKVVQVISVFSVGIFAVIMGILRLSFNLNTDFFGDFTYAMAEGSLWVDLECHVGLWTACFPALQPYIRLAHANFDLLTDRTRLSQAPTLNYYESGSRRSRKPSQWFLSQGSRQPSISYARNSDQDKDETGSTRGMIKDDTRALNPEFNGSNHIIDGNRTRTGSAADLELQDLEDSGNRPLSPMGGNVIHKTTEVSVVITERRPPPEN